MIIIRVRGRERVVRLQLDENSSLSNLYTTISEQVAEVQAEEEGKVEFTLSLDPSGNQIIPNDPNLSLTQCGCINGQLIHLHIPLKKQSNQNNDLDIDALIERQSGRVVRKNNKSEDQSSSSSSLCFHGAAGMCSNCQPLEPFDSKYLEEQGIKHLSFHSYLRKLGLEKDPTDRLGSSSLKGSQMLEEPDFSVKKNCPRHAPFPAGSCSQCIPSAISLNPQSFRFTDHLEFTSHLIVEEFLAEWRNSGYQRFGWLFGTFEPYTEVPLGIKAVVHAIYQPPQDGSIDGFQLLSPSDDEHSKTDYEKVAKELLGLECVGMIYTDLQDDGTRSGKVLCTRSAQTFFLSSAECLFMAEQQQAHPNRTRHSPTSNYGSKFVTAVISGDSQNQISINAYQLSVVGMSMVKANIIQASTDPALMIVRSPSDPDSPAYIPDVLYKDKNEFGMEVTHIAKPTFPVDYLIVSLSHGFPRQESSHRLLHRQDLISNLTDLSKYLLPLPTATQALIQLLSNFNLLLFLASDSSLFTKSDLQLLANVIREKSEDSLAILLSSESWNQLESLLKASNSTLASVNPIDLTADDWACAHCTFVNSNVLLDSCEMCGLPRQF